jgi:subtilisin family serine protease
MPQVWDSLTGTTAIAIAIIDTGVDLNHPDLASKIWTNPGETGLDGSNKDKRTNGLDDDDDGYIDDWRGWDFTGAGDNNPQDGYGHGTHVAGIAGAATNNGLGIAGVNWNAPLMVVRVLDSTGYGTDAQVAAGMVWATDRGAKILNLSLGGQAPSTVLEDAVNYAYNHGVLVVAAAGNYGGQGVIYPAHYAHAFAIANTNSSDVINSSSSYGPEVDVAAPGTNIYSTYWTSGGSGYALLTGTSMATPHVAGVAALLATLPQFDTPDKIRAALEYTALDLGPAGWDQKYGHGLIQAYAAALFDPANITPTPPPPQYTLYTSESCAGAKRGVPPCAAPSQRKLAKSV